MTNKKETNARLTKELLEMAKGMRASGIMPNAAYEKITMRHFEVVGTTTQPLTGDDIRALRTKT